jgi:hypothetical protein
MWVGIFAALGAGATCLITNSVTRAVLAERAGPEKTAAVMAVSARSAGQEASRWLP